MVNRLDPVDYRKMGKFRRTLRWLLLHLASPEAVLLNQEALKQRFRLWKDVLEACGLPSLNDKSQVMLRTEAAEKKKKEEEAQKPSIVAAAGPVVIGQGGKVTTTEPAQATVPAATLTPATPVGKASADMPGYTEIDLKQIPGDVYALMGNGKLVISIGKDEFNMTNMTANAGGALGYQNGKAVAYCTLSADQPYEAIEKADTYTLKLYAPNQTCLLYTSPSPRDA